MEMIGTSEIAAKGQTAIPIEVRELLKLKPGDRLRYVRNNCVIELRAKTGRAADLVGMFHDPQRPASSVEELNVAIGEAISNHTLGK